jgi:hypothetical protein
MPLERQLSSMHTERGVWQTAIVWIESSATDWQSRVSSHILRTDDLDVSINATNSALLPLCCREEYGIQVSGWVGVVV